MPYEKEVVQKFLSRFLRDSKLNLELRAFDKDMSKVVNRIFSSDLEKLHKFILKYINFNNISFSVNLREGNIGTRDGVRKINGVYADQDFKDYPGGESEALELLATFPHIPSITDNSGHGLHSYWIFTNQIDYDIKVEEYVRGIAIFLKTDQQVRDLSRVMRVPGTFNYKYGEKRLVKIVSETENVYQLSDFDQFYDLSVATVPPLKERAQTSGDYDYPIGFITQNCEFLKYCYENQETVPENLWYMMITNLVLLSNGANMVHDFSCKHPKYTERETDTKIVHALKTGPHTCEYIQREMLASLGFKCNKQCEGSAPIAVLRRIKELERYINAVSDQKTREYKWEPQFERLMKFKKYDPKTLEPEYSKISNFMGTITKEIIIDSGITTEKKLEINIKIATGGAIKNYPILVPANKFKSMNWLIEALPASAIIESGNSKADDVRHSIQFLSQENEPEKEVRYAHTGWRKDKDGMFYITNSGAIGRENIKVELDFMRSHMEDVYCLPQLPENELEALKMSLSIVDIGKRSITLPVFLFTYLSIVTSMVYPNISIYLCGESGSYKSALAGLIMCHFGKGFLDSKGDVNRQNVDAICHFDSTANQLEKRASSLKDIICLLDDYRPSTLSRNEAIKQSNVFNHMIRLYGGGGGRARLNADATEKGSYSARGLLLATGETLTTGRSTLARLFEIEINHGDIDSKKLAVVEANRHLLPNAMSSFINWLLNKESDVKKHFEKTLSEVRLNAVMTSNNGDGELHQRQVDYRAYFLATLSMVGQFMWEKGAATEDYFKELREELYGHFNFRLNEEKLLQKEEGLSYKYLTALQTLIEQGKVNLESRYKKGLLTIPSREPRYGDNNDTTFIGQSQDVHSTKIGYFDDNFYYLDRLATWKEISRFYNMPDTENDRQYIKEMKKSGQIIPDKQGESQQLHRFHGSGPKRYLTIKIAEEKIKDEDFPEER